MLFSLQTDQKIPLHTINAMAVPVFLPLFKMSPVMGGTLFISTLFINVSDIYENERSQRLM